MSNHVLYNGPRHQASKSLQNKPKPKLLAIELAGELVKKSTLAV